GSPLKYSFSETKQKKGITIVNLDEKGEVEIDFHEFKPRRDFRIITGELKELIKNDVSSLDNKEDYIKVVLKDKGEILDPMSKLRSVYPNVMELTREDRIKINSTGTVAVNVREKSKLSLFDNFYEDIIGEKCSEEETQVMVKIIEKAEKGGL
ncbi:MAG: exonuclease SbcCD subunit D C-terminal domain-containing protein, partial [Clostridiaceae bacterium]|nr:exonuclease SbcCD subunit D C-terminal domain-containing protein [Clostridiaceae bacterium]